MVKCVDQPLVVPLVSRRTSLVGIDKDINIAQDHVACSMTSSRAALLSRSMPGRGWPSAVGSDVLTYPFWAALWANAYRIASSTSWLTLTPALVARSLASRSRSSSIVSVVRMHHSVHLLHHDAGSPNRRCIPVWMEYTRGTFR